MYKWAKHGLCALALLLFISKLQAYFSVACAKFKLYNPVISKTAQTISFLAIQKTSYTYESNWYAPGHENPHPLLPWELSNPETPHCAAVWHPLDTKAPSPVNPHLHLLRSSPGTLASGQTPCKPIRASPNKSHLCYCPAADFFFFLTRTQTSQTSLKQEQTFNPTNTDSRMDTTILLPTLSCQV